MLTRLHARYSKADLGEDLIFKEAGPIVGGRERRVAEGKLEHSSRPGSVNNFQARYAIRHEWKGAIECESPRRGIWGGPPAGQSKPQTKPATDLAFAARGNIQLASMGPGGIPELGVPATGQLIYGHDSPPVASGPKVPSSRPRTVLPPKQGSGEKSSSSDGCSVTRGAGFHFWFGLLVCCLFYRSRRRF